MVLSAQGAGCLGEEGVGEGAGFFKSHKRR